MRPSVRTLIYDLVGNRLERKVTAGIQTLTTAYEYNANDQLITESNTISMMVGYIPVRIENKYAATANVTRGSPSAGITWMRAPSALSYWAFNSTPYLLLFAFLAPLVAAVARRWTSPRPLRASAKTLTAYRLPLAFRGVAFVLAVAMLILGSPFETLAQEAELYSQIQATNWGQDGSVTNYQYDANGSMTQKVKTEPGKTTTEVFEYNLENRLSAHTKTVDDGIDVIATETVLTYNQAGIRVKSEKTVTVNEVEQSTDTKLFLIDSYNHTGYAQVLEEFNGTDPTPIMSYVIGDDVLAQNDLSAQTVYLLADGHGSTRQLADVSGGVTAQYSFDAYGHMLGQQAGAQAQQATSLLYAGEQFDDSLQQYYLRARYYDQNNGRFNRLDPFGGSNYDPQSLHKYAYAHNDPVNNWDPSGLTSLIEVLAVVAVITILAVTLYGAIFGTESEGMNPSGRWLVTYGALGLSIWIIGGAEALAQSIALSRPSLVVRHRVYSFAVTALNLNEVIEALRVISLPTTSAGFISLLPLALAAKGFLKIPDYGVSLAAGIGLATGAETDEKLNGYSVGFVGGLSGGLGAGVSMLWGFDTSPFRRTGVTFMGGQISVGLVVTGVGGGVAILISYAERIH